MPMIMASAVIRTGRKRVKPASSAALTASPVASKRSRAKLTTSMLLAVATPMHMIAPVSAGTRQRGAGREQHPDDPGQRRRQRGDDDERVGPGLEVHDDQQVDQHHGPGEAEEQARECACSSWST